MQCKLRRRTTIKAPAGRYIFKRSAVGKHRSKPRFTRCICTHLRRVHGIRGQRTPWRYAERTTKRERERDGGTLEGCVHGRRTQQRNLVGWGLYGGYTDGRQAEAHQFPIQFADLACSPILGDSTRRERERERHASFSGSMNRFAIKYPVSPL